ncbi:hypothetical protein JCM8208_001714 [Rhodotorula glutinis]
MRLPRLSLAALALIALAAVPTSHGSSPATTTTLALSSPASGARVLPIVEHTAAPAARRMSLVRRAGAAVDSVRDLDSATPGATAGEQGAAASDDELSRSMGMEQTPQERVAAHSSCVRRARSTPPSSPLPSTAATPSSLSTTTSAAAPASTTALPAAALLSAPLPGRTLAVLPVGLAFTSLLFSLMLAVIAYMAYERLLYRRQFVARRAEDAARRVTRAREVEVEMRVLSRGGGGPAGR